MSKAFDDYRINHRRQGCWDLILDFFQSRGYQLTMSEAAELRIHMRTVWNDQIDDEGRNRKGVVPVSSLHGETIARFFSTRYGVNIEDYTKPPRDLKNVKASEFSEQKTRDLLEWIKIKREEQTSEVNFTRRQRK